MISKKYLLLFICFVSLAFVKCHNSRAIVSSKAVEIDKDPESGLSLDSNLMLVKSQCTACHSAKLISMNRFTREGWKDKISWMQKTQNLWDLGESEPLILDYLSKYYSPEPQAARRKNLEKVVWYNLKE